MISLIICSRSREIPRRLRDNIEELIGVEYELIVIDNSKNRYSIFQAYNEGVKRSKYSYLCFMHDDILYHTHDWGSKIVDHFQDENIGLLGVVGGHYLPDCPASWWSTQFNSGQLIQGYIENGLYKKELISCERYRIKNQYSLQVAVVDGLWFCIPKYLFKYITFDSDIFNGFHCYDTDICLQVNKLGKEVRVVFDILIEHTSEGNQNDELFEQRQICYEKWKEFLPQIKGITLTDYDIEDRMKMTREFSSLLLYRYREIKRLKSTTSYKLGKMLTGLFSKLKRIFK